MTNAEAAGGDRPASAWTGWVLTGVFALSPLLAWVGPLGFAPLAALAGILALRGLKVADSDRPAAIALIVALAWALGSTSWSPYTPEDLEGATIYKLIAQAPLYWAMVCAARTASARTRRIALAALAWGMAGLGLLLCVEAATGAGLYQALRSAMGDPIRPDLAVRNIAQGAFVLALLTPAAILAAVRIGASRWLALPMIAGASGASLTLAADAPPVALVAAAVGALLVWRAPTMGPRLLAVGAAGFFLSAPVLVVLTRRLGWFDQLQGAVSLSWSMRMGYWERATDWIGDRPLQGWGLDASRMFSPGIKLHPHDVPLQIWLELGLIGAMAAAVFWAAAFAGLSRKTRDAGPAVAAGTASAYLTYCAFSFGAWQEWFLAIGALAATACVAAMRHPVPNGDEPSTRTGASE